MKIIFTLAVAIVIAGYIDVPGLLKKNMKKELTVFIVISVIGIILTSIRSIFNGDYAVFTDFMIKIFGGGKS